MKRALFTMGSLLKARKKRLQVAFDNKLVEVRDPLSQEITERVLQGALNSSSASGELKEFCKKALGELEELDF
jgi:hypothetical protein